MCPDQTWITLAEFMESFWKTLWTEIWCQEHINLVNMALAKIYRYLAQFDTFTVQEEVVINDNSYTTKYPIKRVVWWYWNWKWPCISPILSRCECEKDCNSKCKWCGEWFNTIDMCCPCWQLQTWWKLKLAKTKIWMDLPLWFYTYCAGWSSVAYNIPKECISKAYISYIPYQTIVKNKTDVIMIPDELLDILAFTMRYIYSVNQWLFTNDTLQLNNAIEKEIQQISANEMKAYDQNLDFKSNA